MTPEPSISFRELLAYTDYLANRWLNYFRQNPGALDVNLGGKTGTLRDLVAHIVFVEGYFACRLLAKDPPAKPEAPTLDDLAKIHQSAQEHILSFVSSASDDDLRRTQSFGPVSNVSNRKMLAQVALHGVHHWAQVAMEVRQAGFPTEKPQDIILTDVLE